MRIEFDWDPPKAASNRARHGVAFEDAMAVFLDPLALSKLDEDSSEREERWVTIGAVNQGRLLLVVHTYSELADGAAAVPSHFCPAAHSTRDQLLRRRVGDLKKEYDFKGAQRGKFFRKDAVLVPPVRLDPEVLKFLLDRASARGTSLDSLVNELLRKDIELIEAAG